MNATEASQHLGYALLMAARTARENSSVLDARQTIVINCTELGFVIAGTYRDGRHAFTSSMEVEWSDIAVDAHRIGQAVHLVAEQMRRKVASLGARPVR